jgi:crotonobetainyl-CoA:carnitine CoA-transferase CaiB-like acyl-CoA transferase
MLDAVLNLLAQQVAEHTTTGEMHGRVGNLSPSRKPTADLYQGKDGHLLLAVLTEKQYRILFTTLGRTEVFDDPRFTDWFGRMANGPAMKAIIEEALQTDSVAAWEAKLRAADIPCARVWGVDEIIHHPQLAHRDILQTVSSEFGPLTLAGPAFKLAEGSGGITRPPPRVGEHTEEILRAAGYTDTDITTLRACGAVGG